jgi:Protein of unknown function (DUF1279)
MSRLLQRQAGEFFLPFFRRQPISTATTTTIRPASFRLPRRRLIPNRPSHSGFVTTARCFFSLSARPHALRATALLRPRVPGGQIKPGVPRLLSPTNNNPSPTVRALRRLHSSKPNPSPPAAPSQPESLSLSQRLRKLFREYGWSALGVYLLLSALDFPFCFAAVRLLGTERIGHYEHVIVEGAKDLFRAVWPFNRTQREELGDGQVISGDRIPTSYNHGVREAEERNSGEEASTLIPCLLDSGSTPFFFSHLHCLLNLIIIQASGRNSLSLTQYIRVLSLSVCH